MPPSLNQNSLPILLLQKIPKNLFQNRIKNPLGTIVFISRTIIKIPYLLLRQICYSKSDIATSGALDVFVLLQCVIAMKTQSRLEARIILTALVVETSLFWLPSCSISTKNTVLFQVSLQFIILSLFFHLVSFGNKTDGTE